jgi:pimeloyl-ACP methyl ester carboxylesterase
LLVFLGKSQLAEYPVKTVTDNQNVLYQSGKANGPVPKLHGKSHFVTVRGRRFHYLDYGGDGDVIVCMHGMIQHAGVFGAIAPILTQGYRVIAPDMRGRGQSEWDSQGVYRVTEYFKDLDALLEKLGVGRLSLIGTSMGGWISNMFAAAYPDRVERVVLNDSAVGASPAGLNRVADMCLTGLGSWRDIDHALEWFMKDRPWLLELCEEDLRWWVEQHLRTDENGELRLSVDPLALQVAMTTSRRALAASPAERELSWEQTKKLTMQILFLRAEFSDVVPQESVDRLQVCLPHAVIRKIPRVGHAPSLLEPEVHDALREFFGLADNTAAAS